MDDLTDKQELFIGEYLLSLNATKSYQKVYDCAYSTAQVEGCRLLRNPKVEKIISKKMTKTFGNLEVGRERVLREYAKIAFSDISDVADWNNFEVEAKSKEHIGRDARAAISEISSTKDGIKIKLHDKMKALDVLAKYSKLIKEDEIKPTEINITIDNLDAKL